LTPNSMTWCGRTLRMSAISVSSSPLFMNRLGKPFQSIGRMSSNDCDTLGNIVCDELLDVRARCRQIDPLVALMGMRKALARIDRINAESWRKPLPVAERARAFESAEHGDDGDHLVGVVREAVPLATGDEDHVALVLTNWLALAEVESRALEQVERLLGVQMSVEVVRLSRRKPRHVEHETGGAGLGTVDHATPNWQLWIFMALMGLGMGAMMQNLVLAVQNTVDVSDIGSTSATVAFFRSLGGAVGVSVLGAVLANEVQDKIISGLAALGISGAGGGGLSSLDLTKLPAPILHVVRTAYGDATGTIFAIAAGVAVVSFVAAVLIKEVPLRTTVDLKPQAEAQHVEG